jgi:hypothetical protein
VPRLRIGVRRITRDEICPTISAQAASLVYDLKNAPIWLAIAQLIVGCEVSLDEGMSAVFRLDPPSLRASGARPDASAVRAASADGVDTTASIGMPTTAAVCTNSTEKLSKLCKLAR